MLHNYMLCFVVLILSYSMAQENNPGGVPQYARDGKRIEAAPFIPDQHYENPNDINSMRSVKRTTTYTFDFEDQVPGPTASVISTQGPLTMTLTRPGSPFSLSSLSGVPASWGSLTLDPFLDYHSATPFIIDFSSTISSFSVEWGDYGPSDTDQMVLVAYAGPGATGAIVTSIVSPPYSTYFQNVFTTTVSGPNIRSVSMIAGSPDFPHSIFYDLITVQPGCLGYTYTIPYGASGYMFKTFPTVLPGGSEANVQALPVDLVGYQSQSFSPVGFQPATLPFKANDFGCGLPWGMYWQPNTEMILRKTFVLPNNINGAGTVKIIVDNDLLELYFNGNVLVNTPQNRGTCAGVSAEIVVNIPSALFNNPPASNLLAIRVRDRGGQSFVNVQLEAPLCGALVSGCAERAASCDFYFSGHLNDVPFYPIESPDNGPGFSDQILKKGGPTIGVINSNIPPTFVTGINTEIPVSAYNEPGMVQQFTTYQFKTFNQPLPKDGHETFQQNNAEHAKGKCVVSYFSDWQEYGANTQNPTNARCSGIAPNNNCCAVFMTY